MLIVRRQITWWVAATFFHILSRFIGLLLQGMKHYPHQKLYYVTPHVVVLTYMEIMFLSRARMLRSRGQPVDFVRWI